MALAASQATGTPRAGRNFGDAKRPFVSAIMVGINPARLQEMHRNSSSQNANSAIAKRLRDFGFEYRQGSVYFGDDSVGVVPFVLAVPSVVRDFDWFEPSITDIRMLKIENNNDLLPVVR